MTRSFTGTLQASGSGGGRWIVVPFDVKAEFDEARPLVKGTVNGTPFRSRLSVYGGVHYLGLRAEIRRAASLEIGDTVHVELERDDAPRVVEVPEALRQALDSDPVANEIYERLPFTHRKEYAQWIAEAKREDTRTRRIAKALEMIRRRQPCS
ncbi:MAG: YdeI/OmpD-associated family protein [Actinomycetota bacterium]|nr:YdeI/OmpD-associated family protein [Actinomycetota bacterium]